jgi:RHS repeat-associated protein
VGRKVNGTWTQRWLYQNALSVVAELDGAGALKKRFVYASRAHVPDVMVMKQASGPDSTYRLITDHLGSVRLVVNAASGTVAQRMSYDAWGNVTEDTNPGLQPFGYAGGLYDPATGLVRFGARDYDAKVGRWLSRDPIGFAGGETDLYAYVAHDPVNALDPSGAVPIDAPPGGAGDFREPEVGEAFDRALVDPLAAFADGVIPIWDPFEAAGVYRATPDNGLCWSRAIGGWTRNTVGVLAAIHVAGTSAAFARSAAVGRQSKLFAQGTGTLNKSPWVRVGWGGKEGVPSPFFRLVVGSKRWPLPWLRHVDVR